MIEGAGCVCLRCRPVASCYGSRETIDPERSARGVTDISSRYIGLDPQSSVLRYCLTLLTLPRASAVQPERLATIPQQIVR